MKFFIDTANLSQIKTMHDWGILDGVTTNPSLMAKEGISGEENIIAHYKKICETVDGDVSAEVISTDFNGMIQEGKTFASLHKNIVVKVPMTMDGIKAIHYFTSNKIRTNCTLVFSAAQAILAAKAGASYISPFVGRVDDINYDGVALIELIKDIYQQQGYDTKILAASIRNSLHIVKCAKAGADICTAPLSAYEAMFKHPLTDIGLAKFLEDHHNAIAKNG